MVSTLNSNIEITGNLTAGGTVRGTYSDLAEYFLVEGSILCGNPTSIVGFRKVGKYSGRAYAGIRSFRPAMSMGGDISKSSIPIALSGSVKVNTRDRSIKLGDKLVVTKQGTVIRKRWYHLGLPLVGVAQEDYRKNSVMTLV